MDLIVITRLIATAGLILGATGIILRIGEIMRRPFKQDLSRARGQLPRGLLYAFTLGMAPWEKESTRKHWVAYLRGILFHIGVFAAFGVLLSSPWFGLFPELLRAALLVITAAGAAAGFAGIFMRLAGPNERALSLPDDYFSVFLTSLFVAMAFAALLAPAALPVFYLVTALLGIVIPFSKIRHCAYFFYSKFFFGYHFGRRGVIGQAHSKYAE